MRRVAGSSRSSRPSSADARAADPRQPAGGAPVAPAATPRAGRHRRPEPVSLPADDSPHDRLTEWWYYTGHLRGRRRRRFGFEYVIFRAERGAFPVAWASHLAITDEAGERFVYAQRSEVGRRCDRSRPATVRPRHHRRRPDAAGDVRRAGLDDGRLRRCRHLVAARRHGTGAAATGGLGLALDLESTKAAALHDADGWIDFGPAGGSYYYSGPRWLPRGTDARGQVGGRRASPGSTTSGATSSRVGGGGWDWFAVNLDDGSD